MIYIILIFFITPFLIFFIWLFFYKFFIFINFLFLKYQFKTICKIKYLDEWFLKNTKYVNIIMHPFWGKFYKGSKNFSPYEKLINKSIYKYFTKKINRFSKKQKYIIVFPRNNGYWEFELEQNILFTLNKIWKRVKQDNIRFIISESRDSWYIFKSDSNILNNENIVLNIMWWFLNRCIIWLIRSLWNKTRFYMDYSNLQIHPQDITDKNIDFKTTHGKSKFSIY